METEKLESKSKFPWTYNTTNLFINSYEKRIDQFLSLKKSPVNTIWKDVVNDMKKELENHYDENVLALLNEHKLCSKFTNLKKHFKKHFMDLTKTDQEKEAMFAYYGRMKDMFSDYARKHLIGTNITDIEVKNYIAGVLGEDPNFFSNMQIDENKVMITESKLLKPLNVVVENKNEVDPSKQLCLKEKKNEPSSSTSESNSANTDMNQNTILSNMMKRRIQRNCPLEPMKFMKTSKTNETKNEEVNASEFIDPSNTNSACDNDVKVIFIAPQSISNFESTDNRPSFSSLEKSSILPINEKPEQIDNASTSSQAAFVITTPKVNQIVTPSSSSKPPAWFENFLNQYNSDMEMIRNISHNINSKK
ncbi:hypothetical protein PVAND_003133 [Polypedilum vanderplanki]|uniref:Uncharacterized protein n=1 Tax=Polypedilum vanderplanki TaxID=319348 RepID=A0A9J6BTL8_POLVA|nr:hypothetical protein PVAND_003133 [Polypedilum vanderplanki]